MAQARIIAQRQYAQVLADGRVGDVVEVTYQTEMGTVGSVKIPKEVYSPEFVSQAVANEVAMLDAVDRMVIDTDVQG